MSLLPIFAYAISIATAFIGLKRIVEPREELFLFHKFIGVLTLGAAALWVKAANTIQENHQSRNEHASTNSPPETDSHVLQNVEEKTIEAPKLPFQKESSIIQR